MHDTVPTSPRRKNLENQSYFSGARLSDLPVYSSLRPVCHGSIHSSQRSLLLPERWSPLPASYCLSFPTPIKLSQLAGLETGEDRKESGRDGEFREERASQPQLLFCFCQIGLKPCGWTNSGPQWLPKPDSFFIRVVRYSYMEKWLLFAPNSAWVLAHKTHGSQMMWLASNSLQPQITSKGGSSDNVRSSQPERSRKQSAHRLTQQYVSFGSSCLCSLTW